MTDTAEEIRAEVDAWQQKNTADLAGLTLEQAVELALAAAQTLSESAVDVQVDPLPWQDALDLLRTVRRAKWLLDTVDSRLVKHAYLHGEHGKRLIDGIGEVWVGRGRSKEHWDERGVAQAVIDAKMADFEGAEEGRLPDPWDVAEWLLEVLGVGYVRKTALDTLGIPREPFYTSEPGTLKVDLPKLT